MHRQVREAIKSKSAEKHVHIAQKTKITLIIRTLHLQDTVIIYRFQSLNKTSYYFQQSSHLMKMSGSLIPVLQSTAHQISLLLSWTLTIQLTLSTSAESAILQSDEAMCQFRSLQYWGKQLRQHSRMYFVYRI